MQNDLNSVFVRLYQSMLSNHKKQNNNLTVLIGAGCSLSSSNKNITTSYIIKDLVKKYADGRTVPDDWNDLFEAFGAWIWDGLGMREKIETLEEYFEGMEPSEGYKNLRFLVEHGYISNIITTNFDLMIDRVLEGLSYMLFVGDKVVKQIGDDPKFTVVKAHGDLNHGGLLFAPHQLQYLSTPLADKIRQLTKSIIVVVGYSAQDASILSAFDTTAEYSAFWVVYHKPDIQETSKTKPMFNLLFGRESESNLLYGEDYGDFDTLFGKLVDKIKKANVPDYSTLNNVWADSIVDSHITKNIRFYDMQKNMLNILQQQLFDSVWKSVSPYFSSSHLQLLKTAVGYLNDSVLPSSVLSAVRNEVEALLLSLALAGWSACQGYSFTAESLIAQLRNDYEGQKNVPVIKADFWSVLTWLAEVDLNKPHPYHDRYHEIQIAFDQEQNFITMLKRVDINRLSELLCSVQRVLYFARTSCDKQSKDMLVNFSYKQTLEKYLYAINNKSDLMQIELRGMPLREYKQIYTHILKPLFQEHIDDRRVSLSASNMYVDIFLDMSEFVLGSTMWESLSNYAYQMSEEYLVQFIPSNYANLRPVIKLDAFLKSLNPGLFIAGESGSGKTILLKQWINSLDKSKYLVIPLKGSSEDGSKEAGQIAFSEFLFEENLQTINTTLAQHNQTLLLIFDGLNEINGRFLCIETYYKKFLKFCELLYQNEFNNIRLIITCRTEFYHALKRSSGQSPRPGCFYSDVEDGKEHEVLRLNPLTAHEIEGLWTFFQKDQLTQPVSSSELIMQFGDIVKSPLYLNLLCGVISEGERKGIKLSKVEIYRNWFSYILEQASIEQISENAVKEIVQYGIEWRYFKGEADKLNTDNMSRTLRTTNPDVLGVFHWLVERRIFTKRTQPPNLIQYAHDSIEEFFLFEALLRLPLQQLGKLDEIIADDTLEYVIVQHSVRDLLEYLFYHDRLQFINIFVPACRENRRWLINQTYQTIISISKYDGASNEIFLFYKQVEQLLLRKEFLSYIRHFLLAIEQDIDDAIDPGKIVIETLHNVCQQSNCRADKGLLQLSNYIFAKYMFYFAQEHDTDAYKKALNLCRTIIDVFQNQSNPFNTLMDKVNTLYAVILRSLGDIKTAISVMVQVLEHQKQEGQQDDVCASSIELGAMYRDMTMFDEALELYHAVDTSLVKNQLYVNLLYINEGVIYKNRVQNDFFDKNDSADRVANYNKCYELFINAYKYARRSNNIILELEALFELIEASELGYRLDQCTIGETLKWSELLEEGILKYPVPLYRAQYYRVQARVYVLQDRLDEAIGLLIEGFEFAKNYDLYYRAIDCCNIITGIISDNLDNKNFITKERLSQGLLYGKYAIDYYEQLGKTNHRYLRDSQLKYNAIKNHADQL